MPWTKEIIAAGNALRTIHYGRFNSVIKNGPEWTKLAESGTVWDSIYNIRNKEPWMAAQKELEKELRGLNNLQEKVQLGRRERSSLSIMKDGTKCYSDVLANFSWKSCAIEKNPLSLATTRRVEAAMPKVESKTNHVFKEAMKLCLPSAQELIRLDCGDAAMSEKYLELRNNIVATQAALSSPYLEQALKPKELIEDLRATSRVLFLRMKVPFKAGELPSQSRPIRTPRQSFPIQWNYPKISNGGQNSLGRTPKSIPYSKQRGTAYTTSA